MSVYGGRYFNDNYTAIYHTTPFKLNQDSKIWSIIQI